MAAPPAPTTRRSLRARTAAPVPDYGNCPSGPTAQPLNFCLKEQGKIIGNSPRNEVTIRPQIINAYEFDPRDWAKKTRPWNIPSTSWSTNLDSKIWSPPSADVILNTRMVADKTRPKILSQFNKDHGSSNDPECLGKWCWQQKTFGGFLCHNYKNGNPCGHTLGEFMQGCADWQLRIELKTAGQNMGYGAYSKVDWSKGDILGLYLGKLIPVPGDNTVYTQSINIGSKFKQGEGTLPLAYIDAEHSGTWTRFCNHSCTNNAKFDEANVGDTRVLALRATKDIKVNEEITVDYQDEYFEHRQCLCRSGVGKCRYPIQDNPIKRPAPASTSTPVPATPRRAKRTREADDGEYTPNCKRRTPEHRRSGGYNTE